jgi:membrane AbrB-like protein
VTPGTLEHIAAWPLSMAALALSMTVLTAAVTVYLRYVHGWDMLSALFAAAPGGLAQALALATQCGADVRSIAMVQSVRVLLLTVIMPLALASFAATGTPPVPMGNFSLFDAPGELAALVAVCTLVAVAFYRARVPGGLIVGAMTASGVLHGSGLVHVSLPAPVVIASFVMTGAMIGSRFAGMNVMLLLRLLGVGLGALVVGAVVAIGCAVIVAWLLGLRTGDVVMAYAPGGLEAMTILSFALHLDPAFVGVHHLARFLLVSVLIPIAVRFVQPAPRDAT